MIKGLINPVGISSKPAKHFDVIMDHIVNFTYMMTQEFSGAQAFNDIDILIAPYIFYDDLNYEQVKQVIQRLIWNMSFPLRSGFQSVFLNFSLGLRPSKYYDNKPIIHPKAEFMGDGYNTYQKEIDMFNKALLEVMIEGSDGHPFTFPLLTYKITKDFNWDSKISNLIFQYAAKWGGPYFSNYLNTDFDENDALSMCPLHPKEKVLIKSTRYQRFEFSDIGNLSEKEYEVYSNGKFVKGKFIKYDNQEMIKITLANNHEITMSKNHLNFVMNGKNSEQKIVKASELNNEMYLPYSLNIFEGKGGNRELGYLVGASAGDGSFGNSDALTFCLCKKGKKVDARNKIIEISEKYFGANYTEDIKENEMGTFLNIYSRGVHGLCSEFVRGIKTDRYLSPKIFEMSKEFREGFIEGYYATDGGNRHRIYTSSIEMVKCLNMLAATLGTTTAIQIDDRKETFEGYTRNAPNYAVLFYQLNRESYGNIWFKENNKLWIKIKTIETKENSNAYCFEVSNNEPIFTVGTTGILTHNCRLRLNINEIQKISGGLWSFGNNTGSIAVATINMPQLGYITKGDEKAFYLRLDSLLEEAKQYLLLKKEYVMKGINLGLYPMIKNYISGKMALSYFLTIGITGLNECSINFCGKNIIENAEWCEEVLKYIKQRTFEFQQETGQLINFEATPAEGCGHTLAKLDKKNYPDMFIQGNDSSVYYTGSSFCPNNIKLSLSEAIRHQEKLQRHYTGGTVFHLDIGEEASAESVKKIIKSICTETTLPYVTWSPTYGICPIHGQTYGKEPCCEKSEIMSRIVGFYRPISRWNAGKLSEFKSKKFIKI